MAKGDRDSSQNAINQYGNQAWQNTGNMKSRFQTQNSGFQDDYTRNLNRGETDYNEIMNNYRMFLNRNQPNQGPQMGYSGNMTQGNPFTPSGGTPNFNEEYEGYRNLSKGGVNNSDLNSALAGYGEFAKTGGFSPQDIQNLRARAISPTRSVYANAQANIDRQRMLQGGYSPNYTAAQAKLSRDLGQSVSDANVNANASIAEAQQRGKLAGLQGQSTTAIQIEQLNNQMKMAGLGGMTDVDKARLSAQLSNSQQNLQALSGMRDTYSATPGLAALSGSMLRGSNQDMLNAQGQENNLGLGLIQAYQRQGQMPSDFQQGLGNASSIMGLLGGGSGFLGNLGGSGGWLKYLGFGGGGNGNSDDPYSPDALGFAANNNSRPPQVNHNSIGTGNPYPGLSLGGNQPGDRIWY